MYTYKFALVLFPVKRSLLAWRKSSHGHSYIHMYNQTCVRKLIDRMLSVVTFESLIFASCTCNLKGTTKLITNTIFCIGYSCRWKVVYKTCICVCMYACIYVLRKLKLLQCLIWYVIYYANKCTREYIYLYMYVYIYI